MRLTWLTDIHLNFLDRTRIGSFAAEVSRTGADVVLITGDIAEGPSLQGCLQALSQGYSGTLLYVLGNHDYYRASVGEVRGACSRSKVGVYLHNTGPYHLTDRTCVVGVDGWADGGFGAPLASDLIFTDWVLIEEFRQVDAVTNPHARLRVAREFSDESARALSAALRAAAAAYEHVIVLTHVPPFSRAAGDDGSAMAQIWLPWLACRSTGEALTAIADEYPDVEFEVLCGHTHVARVSHERPNIRTVVGAATYGAPEVQRVWEIG